MDKRLISDSEWLADKDLQKLLAVLSQDGEKARIVGGAVRNTLLGEAVSDIDIATTTLPRETVKRARKAGFRTAPTGIDHGTITVIAERRAYEVTTLRSDVATDGRRASVTFGRDWQRDAERRDFTINALYAEACGEIVDLVGGVADLESRTLRFIGEAETRIREDYLRILRFFRFFAWYGRGRPDAEGLKASARLKDGLEKLSAERVWSELRKLLGAPDPSRALLWMRQTGVLTKILPETEKWGIDAIPALLESEGAFGWEAEPLLRMAAMLPPDAVRMRKLAARLRFSRVETSALVGWALAPAIDADMDEKRFRKIAYRADTKGLSWRLKLALASARSRAVGDDAALSEAAGFARLLKELENWRKPSFPVSGKDLLGAGFKPGKAMGDKLAALEERWVQSDFLLSRAELLEKAGAAKGV